MATPSQNGPDPQQPRSASDDLRIYIPRPQGWEIRIMTSGEREYCYLKHPGEDHFHLIVPGEVYMQHGEEKYCLNCARRINVVTTDRLFWQRQTEGGSP
ncbi:MAG: hypothetical protein GXP27_02140 [Planctomycetes bacterium]|nr:hypothetical protein [Planctomycetota bacterium]